MYIIEDEVEPEVKLTLVEPEVKLTEVELEVKLTEVDKHRENIRTILLSTNATPIGRYGSLGYNCCYCNEVYSHPKDLKKHTIGQHDEGNISTFMHNYTMPNYIVKLDITGLRCEMCMKPFSDLKEIIQHLAADHEKYFHEDIPSHIVPFRFDSDILHCVECSFEYKNFKILLEHMNSHYRNHICEVCEAGFVNKRMFQSHMYRHKTGVFKCGFCSKVFDTRIKVKVHERMVHVYLKKKPKCSVCGAKFKDFDKMIKHEADKHGLTREFNCDMCKRMFTNEKSYKVHKKYHCVAEDNG